MADGLIAEHVACVPFTGRFVAAVGAVDGDHIHADTLTAFAQQRAVGSASTAHNAVVEFTDDVYVAGFVHTRCERRYFAAQNALVQLVDLYPLSVKIEADSKSAKPPVKRRRKANADSAAPLTATI